MKSVRSSYSDDGIIRWKLGQITKTKYASKVIVHIGRFFEKI